MSAPAIDKPEGTPVVHSEFSGQNSIKNMRWNLLAITYNVSNKPPSQSVVNQILETTMKNTDLQFVVISLQVT